MSRKLWNVIPYDKKRALELASETGADEFAVLLLLSRGIDTPEKIDGFFNAGSAELSDPYLLKDMDKAVKRIREGIDSGEKMLVYGDYDADGVTATALLYSYLLATGAQADYYIPSRIDEGYGLSAATAEKILEGGFSLVITVDNGIAAIDEAEFFALNGIDLIVTDHHKTGEVLPRAVAVIDPHRSDDTSPCEELAGVGVAMKLAAALEDGDYSAVFDDFGDIVTLGTVADIVPLTGENRTIVSRGLTYIENTERPGLVALMEALSVADKEINASTVAFTLAPKINAAGRMDSAYKALELLITEDCERAQQLVDEINEANSLRQSAENGIVTEAQKILGDGTGLGRVIVVAGKGWHPGVIGIAASRLVEKYGRPAAVISIGENGVCRGSARSIEGFSLYDALSFSSSELIQFGGHTLAAGFSVAEDKIDSFRDKINEYADKNGNIFPTLNIDCRLNPANISIDIYDSLSLLEPFGASNPAPVFGLFGVRITEIKPMKSNKHIRLTVRKQDVTLNAVYFGMSTDDFPFSEGDTVDLAVKIEKNEYMGSVRLSIQIKDVRPAGSDDISLFASLACFDALNRGEKLPSDVMRMLEPSRELLGKVFRFIKEKSPCALPPEIIAFRLGEPSSSAGAVSVCLAALTEVGVLLKTENGYADAKFSGKADLSNSSILNKFKNNQ